MNTIVITGGHHSSALEVIKELRSKNPNINIFWYGHKTSLQGSKNETLEYQEIKALKIPFYNLQAGKFYKTLNPVRILKIPLGFFQALFLLLKHKPEVILSFGGYLGVPVVLAGWVLGIPTVTHEQTVVIGHANKLISKFADRVLYTWDESLKHIPSKKAVKTGLPLREELTKPKHEKYISDNNLPTIYITAGKTGSHIINEAVLSIIKELLKVANVIHQTGAHSGYKDHEKAASRYEEFADDVLGKYFIEKFIFSEDIGDAYHQADLVISRSGAHTILEVMRLNKPCLLIPIPWSSHNEQEKNARLVERSGLGYVMKENEIKNAQFFLKVIKEMLTKLDAYKCSFDPVDTETAAANIVYEIQKTIREKNKS